MSARDELAAAILGPNDLPSSDEWDDSHIDPKYAADRVLKDFIVISKSDLPEVTRSKGDSHTYYAGGENIVYTGESNARDWCLRDIAVWQFIANEELALNARRDDLARELAGEAENDPGCRVNYAGMVRTSQLAIDRIIALEQAQS
jgi:hypothetical protein